MTTIVKCESLNFRLTLSWPVAVFRGLSVYINLNQVNLSYLCRTVKGAPLPSYQRRINVGPSSHQLRTPFSGDCFMGRLCIRPLIGRKILKVYTIMSINDALQNTTLYHFRYLYCFLSNFLVQSLYLAGNTPCLIFTMY